MGIEIAVRLPLQTPGDCDRSIARKSERVDECSLPRKAPESWLGIAGLWFWRHRANFDEAETKIFSGRNNAAIFVESRGESNGIVENQTA